MIVQLLCNNSDLLSPYCESCTQIILLQSGVYCAHTLVNAYPEITVYALEQDYLASGLAPCDSVKLISTAQWVELCALHYPVISIQ